MEEKIEFQYVMNSAVYRKKMIFTRVLICLLIAGGLSATALFHVVIGILLPIVVLFIGAVWILVGLQKEMTYTVLNTRFVIKNKERRISVPLENVVSVKYNSAFYEKKHCTGTITISAKSPDNGKIKKYKMVHVFDGKAGAEYISAAIDRRNNKEEVHADEKD